MKDIETCGFTFVKPEAAQTCLYTGDPDLLVNPIGHNSVGSMQITMIDSSDKELTLLLAPFALYPLAKYPQLPLNEAS